MGMGAGGVIRPGGWAPRSVMEVREQVKKGRPKRLRVVAMVGDEGRWAKKTVQNIPYEADGSWIIHDAPAYAYSVRTWYKQDEQR